MYFKNPSNSREIKRFVTSGILTILKVDTYHFISFSFGAFEFIIQSTFLQFGVLQLHLYETVIYIFGLRNDTIKKKQIKQDRTFSRDVSANIRSFFSRMARQWFSVIDSSLGLFSKKASNVFCKPELNRKSLSSLTKLKELCLKVEGHILIAFSTVKVYRGEV